MRRRQSGAALVGRGARGAAGSRTQLRRGNKEAAARGKAERPARTSSRPSTFGPAAAISPFKKLSGSRLAAILHSPSAHECEGERRHCEERVLWLFVGPD